jgi:uncharacterized protein
MQETAKSTSYRCPFGDRILEDDNHLIVPSIWEIDGEDRFKVVGIVEEKVFTGVFVWRAACPASSR